MNICLDTKACSTRKTINDRIFNLIDWFYKNMTFSNYIFFFRQNIKNLGSYLIQRVLQIGKKERNLS
jgi:hypothetical protein